MAWDREAGRGLGTDKTISKLLFNLESRPIGLSFKLCVLERWQSRVRVGRPTGALEAIRGGGHGRAGEERVASASERAVPWVPSRHQCSLARFYTEKEKKKTGPAALTKFEIESLNKLIYC